MVKFCALLLPIAHTCLCLYFSLSLFLSISVDIPWSLCLCLCLFVSVSHIVSVFLSLSFTLNLSINIYVYLCRSLSCNFSLSLPILNTDERFSLISLPHLGKKLMLPPIIKVTEDHAPSSSSWLSSPTPSIRDDVSIGSMMSDDETKRPKGGRFYNAAKTVFSTEVRLKQKLDCIGDAEEHISRRSLQLSRIRPKRTSSWISP